MVSMTGLFQWAMLSPWVANPPVGTAHMEMLMASKGVMPAAQ